MEIEELRSFLITLNLEEAETLDCALFSALENDENLATNEKEILLKLKTQLEEFRLN